MKLIKLLKLRLLNFKGIKDLAIDFNGNDADISGANATGKTTINDAFMWMLFGKDTNNRQDFQVKTLDNGGNPFHGLDHLVEATLDINDKEVSLKKIYKEKWTKSRGSAERTLTGHTTDYYIDDVPVKKKEYEEYINEIMNEEQFKLITNVLYFNQQLGWKKRRKILLDICGDVSDDAVIASNKKLEGLVELLNNCTVEELRAKVKSKRKLLNDELKTIPIRIDEITRSMPEIVGQNHLEILKQEIRDLEDEAKSIDNKILSVGNVQDAWDSKNKILANKKRQLSTIQFTIEKAATDKLNAVKRDKYNLEADVVGYQDKIVAYESNIARIDSNISKNNQRREQLIKEYDIIDAVVFDVDEDFKCPTCGQELPPEMVEEKIEQLKANFFRDKESNLSRVKEEGQQINADTADLNAKKEKYAENITAYKDRLESSEIALQKVKVDIQAAERAVSDVDINDSKEYSKLREEIAELEAKLDNPDSTVKMENDALLDRKSEIALRTAEINAIVAKQGQIERNDKRIEELKVDERRLAEEIANLEKQEYMTEEFIRTKVELLDRRINSKFETVKFKMFNQLVNGALEECCETTINGVPFSDANNAAKINAGLDIINTLAKHYEVQAPIFIDNRESINTLLPCESQVISLIVSRDKELRIVVGDPTERGVA